MVKYTHQIFLINKRKKTNGVKKGQINTCLRKYVSFDIFFGGYLELLLWKKNNSSGKGILLLPTAY